MSTSIELNDSAIGEMNDQQLLQLCRGASCLTIQTDIAGLAVLAANDEDTKASPENKHYHADQLLNVSQLAELLGVKVSTVYTWRSKCPDKLPPHVDIGTDRRSTIRYRYSDVKDFLKRR
ncbi:helix-turn-helix transcriptional regulator [Endozoicomonas atrinae]|uniref:helix-turn-helix transcriptional regulator n=1 Tax=Endozoicomonas atrinae TaxID=1333660 RepID=UPI000826A82F|nr:helix-turn-helix domain-containing protein [Endozoicomonas atrinae]